MGGSVPNLEVRSAEEEDQQAVIDVITLAFSTDPMARFAYPNPATYLVAMPETIKAFGGRGFAHGTVHIVGDGGAAAMWLPPGVDSDSERLGALSDQYSPPERLADLEQVFEQMSGYHPQEPCWFLPLIGVDPARQGCGYGSALLRHALEGCDRDGVAAYLESSNPRNVPLYERHGFEVLGSIQAGASPTIVPRLRRPKRPGA